ncbi:hypothetical protein CAAN1_21S00716 [[Candida] anglica]|uniref:Uncharacterized protein n=1 Tax=[Candida] anglica TaxID=148631 RepID=A0ABP0EDX9_9ASCO
MTTFQTVTVTNEYRDMDAGARAHEWLMEKRAETLPSLTTKTKDSLPTLTTEAMPTISDPNAYTTPAVSVPPNNNNPYILRETNPAGTVFIAVGAIVGAILLLFISFHLIKSFRASRLAKKTANSMDGGKYYEKFTENGLTPATTTFNMNTEYSPSVAKLPLLSNHKANRSVTGGAPSLLGGDFGGGSQAGDASTIYQSEAGTTTSKHDLTRMFISPTAEVMTHKRVRSSNFGGSVTNVSLVGGSQVNLHNPSPATNRYSQAIPSLYMNSEQNDSDYSVPVSSPQRRAEVGRAGKKKVPSMYLDDLIDQ